MAASSQQHQQPKGGNDAKQQNENNCWASGMLQVCVSVADEKQAIAAPCSPASQSGVARVPSSNIILFKKVAAEFVGTFLLIFAAEGAAIMNNRTNGSVTYIGVGLAAGLAVATIILAIGHISGAHLNPAATIAFATIKEFKWLEVPFYIIAQMGASIFAAAALKEILNYDGLAGQTIPSGTPLQAFLVEIIITFILMFIATPVSVDNRAVRELAGPTIGATVLLNNIIAGALTGASMNPVRTLGPAIVANNYKDVWVYIIAPIIGAVAGSTTYKILQFDCVHDSRISAKPHLDQIVASLK